MENWFLREDECIEIKLSEGAGAGMFIGTVHFNEFNLYYVEFQSKGFSLGFVEPPLCDLQGPGG